MMPETGIPSSIEDELPSLAGIKPFDEIEKIG
jgi:hypothetical protein